MSTFFWCFCVFSIKHTIQKQKYPDRNQETKYSYLLASSRGSEQSVPLRIPFSCLEIYLKTTPVYAYKQKTI